MLIRTEVNKADAYYKTFKVVALLKDWPLKDLDLKVLGQLLFHYNEMSLRMDGRIVDRLFLNKEMKDEIIAYLGTGYNSFMNCLTRLRKFGLIDEHNGIKKELAFKGINNPNFKVQLVVDVIENKQ